MNQVTVRDYLLSMPGANLDYPFGKEDAVYMIKGRDDVRSRMFAIINEGSQPLRLSLRCDPQLANLLREKYESVMPGRNLSRKHWNTIILSGQLPWEEIQGLIRHSYNLVSSSQ